ncbi:hypothetical protein Tco_1071630 [Tanacetum coccineum]
MKLPGSFSFRGMTLLIVKLHKLSRILVHSSPVLLHMDMAYWVDLIRRIECESASMLVEIDLTWSLGFVLVELGRLPYPLSYSTLLIFLICTSNVIIDAHWFLMATSIEAQISLIKLEFSSCLFADSLMNLLRVSSIECLRSWYEGLALFL